MNITDCAYMRRMQNAALYPALTLLEAAMLPAKPPRAMGALRHARMREETLWRLEPKRAGKSAYRQKIWVR